MAQTYYFKNLMGAYRVGDGKGKPIRCSRGDVIRDDIAPSELDRMLRHSSVATEAEWHGGESRPHHLRKPHRSDLSVQDRPNEPEDVPNQPAPKAPKPDAVDLPDSLEGLGLEDVAALYVKGRGPKVSDLMALVGDNADYAQLVKTAEAENIDGGNSRKTLVADLDAVIDAAAPAS